MENEFLAEGEKIVGSWDTYIGGEAPDSAKITGMLHVTDKGVHFEAGLSLKENAGAQIGIGIQAFKMSDRHVTIPYSEIAEVKIEKKLLILKTLNIILKSGKELSMRFGAMSPQAAYDAISSRIA
ncbi:hypothetical protein ACFLQR_03130 [Verrucomicrobiota bacterium]